MQPLIFLAFVSFYFNLVSHVFVVHRFVRLNHFKCMPGFVLDISSFFSTYWVVSISKLCFSFLWLRETMVGRFRYCSFDLKTPLCIQKIWCQICKGKYVLQFLNYQAASQETCQIYQFDYFISYVDKWIFCILMNLFTVLTCFYSF